jgi:hypothetical protein
MSEAILYFVWRPTSTGWRPDQTDANGIPLGEYTLAAAVARVEALKEAYRRRGRRRPMVPPQITKGHPPGVPPARKPRRKTMIQRADVPTNGRSYRPVAIPESHHLR